VSLKKLGRYELVRVLGKGAMGIVYEGKDPNLDRRVAIKTVKVENLSEEAAAEYEHRFRTEARSAARLQHPNIVSVYDSDRDGDIAFLVMEYIQGDDLKHHLDKGVRYSLEQSLKMIRDLLSALDYAHKQGIVHRDIKPANLLIEPGGRVKLTDFGVARIQDSGEATRTQGSMVGTLKYMAPEQVQGQKIDSRADLFSVGVVLYQLLTDKRPFDGDNDFSIIHQIIGHTPAHPSTINPKLPTAIDAVVARALAKNRDERFASARDFAAALQSAIRRAEEGRCGRHRFARAAIRRRRGDDAVDRHAGGRARLLERHQGLDRRRRIRSLPRQVPGRHLRRPRAQAPAQAHRRQQQHVAGPDGPERRFARPQCRGRKRTRRGGDTPAHGHDAARREACRDEQPRHDADGRAGARGCSFDSGRRFFACRCPGAHRRRSRCRTGHTRGRIEPQQLGHGFPRDGHFHPARCAKAADQAGGGPAQDSVAGTRWRRRRHSARVC